MSKKLQGNLMLLLTALIWGVSFVAQRAGMEYIGPFTFNGIRCLIGGLVLIPVILLFNRKKNGGGNKEVVTEEEKRKQNKTLLIGGISCGIILFVASSLQQVGVIYTTAGKAGFITALYIVLVPIMGLFIGKKIRSIVWLCVVLAVIGLYLLCIKEGFSFGKGDLLVLFCAFVFALHILVIDHFSPNTDGIKLSCMQFFISGVISLIPMFLLESPDWGRIVDCWLPILYAGILSCGVAYTLQILAQRDTDPTVASLLLSLESVFAVIAGVIILHEHITLRELCGCVIMFAAILLAQVPTKEERLNAKKN